jgi:hypothetical protein
MSSNPEFKRVNGYSRKVESICMKCLLAIGISSSDEELNMKESQHQCKSETGEGDSLQNFQPRHLSQACIPELKRRSPRRPSKLCWSFSPKPATELH